MSIKIVHYLIHRKGVATAEKAKLPLKDFEPGTGIDERRLRAATYPWYVPDLGITILGYEHDDNKGGE